jgi:hypothetical protein
MLYCLLALSCLGVRAARCVVAQGVPLSEGDRETGSHWVAHACMGREATFQKECFQLGHTDDSSPK